MPHRNARKTIENQVLNERGCVYSTPSEINLNRLGTGSAVNEKTFDACGKMYGAFERVCVRVAILSISGFSMYLHIEIRC